MKKIYISHKNGGEPSTFQDPSPDSSTDPEVASHHGPGGGRPPPPTPPGGLARMVALELGEEGYPDSAMVLRGVPPTSARAFRFGIVHRDIGNFFLGGIPPTTMYILIELLFLIVEQDFRISCLMFCYSLSVKFLTIAWRMSDLIRIVRTVRTVSYIQCSVQYASMGSYCTNALWIQYI